MGIVPYLPDSAPFTTEQRAWLNGLLAGMFSQSATAATETGKSPVRVTVLYGSQTGNGEGLARKIAKELKAKGHVVESRSLDGYEPAALAREAHALFIVSTYGEGEAPEPARRFFEQLSMEGAPRLESLSYTVLALGDRHYEQFCRFGIDLDERLEGLGARRLCQRVECDVDVEEPFSEWKKKVFATLETPSGNRLAAPAGERKAAQTQVSDAQDQDSQHRAETPQYTRERPLLAIVREKRALTQNVSSKLTMHVSFSTADSGLRYEAGDACGILPENDPRLIDEILFALSFEGEDEVTLQDGRRLSLRESLTHHLQITRLNRKMVQSYATKGRCTTLEGLLIPEQQAHLESYMYDRGLIDLLTEYPGVIHEPQELISMLPKLAPRLYSISSSPAAHGDELHATVAVVRYRSHNRERGGLCSTMLSDRMAPGQALPLYIQPNKKFRLPKEKDRAMIMIGPGTGIAPFRAFLHERRATGAAGRNWLFFGERSAQTDFLYREELEAMAADGHLSRLDTAFSRDQDHKIYVQDRMLEHSAMLWNWLEDGAAMYVCGDAKHMAKDVDAALHRVVEQQGKMNSEAARDYVQALKDSSRYQRDVY